MIGIYKITNTITNKVYIGQSININTRWYCHNYLLLRNKHPNKHLQNAWNKYGANNFKFEIIEKCCPLLLNAKETYWYRYYCNLLGKKNTYNIGHTGMVGTMSDEQKKMISKYNKNYYKTHKNPMQDKHFSIETKKKMSEIRKKYLAEHPEKILRGAKNGMFGKHFSKETLKLFSEMRGKKIIVDKKDIYNSEIETAKALGVSSHTISVSAKKGWKVKGHIVNFYSEVCV